MLKAYNMQDIDLRQLGYETIKWNAIGCNGVHDRSQERKALQHKIFLEEIQELEDAVNAEDAVEMLDAFCDIVFVGIYADYLGEYELKSDGLHTKISDITFEGSGLEQDVDWVGLVDNIRELAVENEYGSIVYAILVMMLVLDVDFKGAYENVVNSNYTKFPLTDDINLGKELTWFEQESKYDDVCVEEFDGHYIFRCDGGEGKIVKPQCFCEPQLEQFIGGK